MIYLFDPLNGFHLFSADGHINPVNIFNFIGANLSTAGNYNNISIQFDPQLQGFMTSPDG